METCILHSRVDLESKSFAAWIAVEGKAHGYIDQVVLAAES